MAVCRPAGGPGDVQGGAGLGSEGAEEEDGQVGEVVGDVLDDGDRLGVGVVQILQDHDAAAFPPEDGEQTQQGLGEFDHGDGEPGAVPPPFGHQLGQGGAEGVQFWFLGVPAARNREERASISGR